MTNPARPDDAPVGAAGLAQRLLDGAHQAGFDLAAITPLAPPASAGAYLAWLEKGYHGEMGYLARPDAVARRLDANLLLPGACSALVVGANYNAGPLPSVADDPSRGVVARYAWGQDYHDLLGARLRGLAESVTEGCARPVTWRAYVDSGPILERDLAQRAGLGFLGKNTHLIAPGLGSWLFLGEVLLDCDLPAAVSEQSARAAGGRAGTCGACTRCLEACPTGALVAPGVLDARRCISYLTIELKGPIPLELRPLLGNRIFGCDICQDVCPWNRRYARPTGRGGPPGRTDEVAPHLLTLLALDDVGFGRQFGQRAIRRARRRGLLRNVAVALGNWGDPAAVPGLVRALEDAEPLIRGAAAWALGRTATACARSALDWALRAETHEQVLAELRLALGWATTRVSPTLQG